MTNAEMYGRDGARCLGLDPDANLAVTPKPTSALAKRIAHDIAEQIKSDGEIWEEWMADYIEQEAMEELVEALRELVKETHQHATGDCPKLRAACRKAEELCQRK